MMDEAVKDRLIADSEAGRKAAALMEGLQEVMQSVEDTCMRAWREARTTEDREALWHRVTALENVKQELRLRVERGQYANHQLNQ